MNDVIDALSAYGVDFSVVRERFVNDDALYYSCLDAFWDDASFTELAACIKAKQYEAAFEHAHTLKGVAANLELAPLLAAIVGIVEPLRHHDYSDLDAQLAAVQAQQERLREILR